MSSETSRAGHASKADTVVSGVADTLMASDPPPAEPPDLARTERAPEQSGTSASAALAGAPAAGVEDLSRGALVGRYVVLERVGAGGMAVVYAAYDPELDRKVALKLLHPDTSGSGGASDGRARLVREAQALARLSHPNVVAVHDAGTFGDEVFLAMEFVEGRTLEDWMQERRRSWREVLEVLVQAGRGLAAAHAASLVHRDFKPRNVLLGKDGRPRVGDFGLARPADRAPSLPPTPAPPPSPTPAPPPSPTPPPSPAPALGALALDLTQPGELLGTPAYMALEQITGGSTDARTDQFAFCVVLHEALYGERPFEGDSLIAISKQIASERVREAPGSAGVPAWLRRVVLRGLRAAPHDRYPSMDSLLADLTRDRGALLRRIVAAVAVVALMGATALVALRALGHKSAVCRGAEAQLDGVWDGARRRHVLAAFARTGKPFAAKAYAEVVAYLDKHARDWVAMRTDACEATRVRGEQSEELLDRRMACLSERLEEMRALADLLSRADTVVVAKSLQAAHALPPVQTCGDLAPLAARVSPPSDSAARARVASLRARLSEAEVLLETGKPEQAAEIARSALDEARPLRYPPLEAVAEYLLGRASAKRGDLPAAEQALAEAVWAATAGRADDVVADAATALVYVVGYELGRPDRGRLWASFAKAALDRLGKDEKREGHLTNNTAALLYAEGRYDEALDTYRRGLGLAEKASGPASLDVSVIATNIGGMHEELAQYDQAVPYFERGLAIREKLLGPEHPEVAQSLRGLGHALAYVGQAQRALSLLERAQATAERALGADHGMVALVLGCLGDALQASGRSDDALARYEQAAAGIERAYGPGSARLVEVLNAAGELERKRGRIDKAITTHTQALERARAGLGAEHLEVAISHYYIGRAHAARGDHRAALQEYGRASAIADKLLRREGPLMGILLVAVGESQLGARNLAGAKATLEQALRVLESNRVDPYEQARARLALSRALRALGEQPERAGKLAAAAKDAFAATGARASNELADAEAWLRAGPDLRAPGHP